MEEAEAKQQLLPNFFLFATVKEHGVRNGVVEVGSKEICSHPFRWLVGHFYSVLENADRKLFGWITSQPQSNEVGSRNKFGYMAWMLSMCRSGIASVCTLQMFLDN